MNSRLKSDAYNSNLGDYILSFAAVLQSFLVILQQCLISILHMEPESTTIYRVLLSAFPILFAFLYIFKRKFLLMIIVYIVALLTLLFHCLLFPSNVEYIRLHSLRFLLPIVIPTMLAVISVKRFEIFEKVLYIVSWFTFMLAFIYSLTYMIGLFFIDNYNMSFSYGLLLPTLILFSRKKWYSILASFIMLFLIITIGSRGAAVVIIIYFIYDMFFNNRKMIPIFIISSFILLASLPFILDFLGNIGIQSRTLWLLAEGNIAHDSGRSDLYTKMLDIFWENPILGIGLYGDRVHLYGVYCHNILLELYLDWGIILATILIVFFIYKWIKIFISLDVINKNKIIMFGLATILPLWVSGSYLDSYDMALFLGIMFRLKNNKE